MNFSNVSTLVILICSLSNTACNTHGHDSYYEDEVLEFDTTCSMIDSALAIDTLNYLKHKKFAFIETKIDSTLLCDEKFWKKYMLPLNYMYERELTKLDFTEDEGWRYVIISKSEYKNINLVLIGRSDFKEDMMEDCDLLITDKNNYPIFFCYFEDLAREFKIEKFTVTDSLITTRLGGEKYSDGFIEFIEMDIKLDFSKRTVDYHKAWNLRTEWD